MFARLAGDMAERPRSQHAGFFRIEREIAEALTGAHFSRAQDQVNGVHGADRVATWRAEQEIPGGLRS
jgi:hypothetical protein